MWYAPGRSYALDYGRGIGDAYPPTFVLNCDLTGDNAPDEDQPYRRTRISSS